MKFSLAAITSTLVATALALPATDILARRGSRPVEVFKIKDFTLSKSNSDDIGSVSFRILATTGGTLDFVCKQFDSTVGRFTTDDFREDYIYMCGADSLFTWNFTPKTGVLRLWHDVSETLLEAGEVTVDTSDPRGEYRIAMKNLLL